MSVEIKNLTKVYGNQKAVDNLSFSVEQGQILGFLGPNGAGKSTTMKVVTGFLAPSSGTAVINGYDVQQHPIEVRRHIGYLPEHNPLYLDMYVHEYLQFIGSLHGLRGKGLRERVKDMVVLCGLTVEQKKKIGALSKGYRQRVGLAQALVHDPQVLILDEPTTGLDPNQILEIRQVIKSIGREKTVIFSTHIMQEVKALCDRVVIINKGQLVADSDVASLDQSSRRKPVVVAEFEHPVDVVVLEALAGITAVEPGQGNTYRISAAPGTDLRSAIFRMATANNWSLVGLRQEESSLETVFQDLTKSVS